MIEHKKNFIDLFFYKDFHKDNKIFSSLNIDEGPEFYCYRDMEYLKIKIRAEEYTLKNFNFENKVIINLENEKSSLNIENCHFKKGISIHTISLNHDGNLFIFRSIIDEAINIGLSFSRIEIDTIYAEKISFIGLKSNQIDFFTCHIKQLVFESCLIQRIQDSNRNQFGIMKIYESVFIENNFKIHSFVDLQKNIENFCPEKFINIESYKDIPNNDLKLEQKAYANEYFLEFINFLLSSKSKTIDNDMIASLNLLLFKFKNNKTYIRFILKAFGYFYKPLAIIKNIAILILIFGIFFYILKNYDRPIVLKNVVTTSFWFDIWNSIFISAKTFFTIAYSDLADNHKNMIIRFCFQVLTILETACGMTYVASFLIALINKYMTRNR